MSNDTIDKGILAIMWGIGFTIGHLLVGFSDPESPIIAMFILGIIYLAWGVIDGE